MAVGEIPALARSSVEQLPNDRIGPASIVWSTDEFYAASEALASFMQEPGRGRRGRGRSRRNGGSDLLRLAGAPRELGRLIGWFDERYRAHAPRIALMHLDRFHAIWEFLGRHMERLRRERLVTVGGEGTVVDEHLLAALVSVDYRPAFLGRSRQSPNIGSYEAVLALAGALRSGEARVEEFRRTPPEAGRELRTAGAATPPTPGQNADAFELEDFSAAMAEWSRLNGLSDRECQREAAALEGGFPEVLEEGFDTELALMLHWFLERFEDVEVVSPLFMRFLVMGGFIEEHLEKLLDVGLLKHRGNGYQVSGALFSTLNNLPLTSEGPDQLLEPFEYDTVISIAEAHRDVLGDHRILSRERERPRRRPLRPLSRNHPCSCGSGRKAKRCCWSRVT